MKDKWNKIPIEVKVSVSYTICSILQKCLSFITVFFFARLLTTEQYGQYTIYSSWSGILSIFLTLNLAYGSFSTAMIKYENDRDSYISSVQGISVVCLIVFLIIYLPLKGLWNGLFELPTFLILVMIAEILTSNALFLWNGKKRFEYKYKSVVAITLIMSVLSPLLAYILVVNSTEKGYARILGYAIVNILFGFAFFVFNLIKGKSMYKKEYWKYALSFNIPLLAYYLSQVVFNQSDRIMISRITGKSDAAMYGVAYNLATILTFVMNAINNSYVPWYYGKIKEGKQKENQSVSCSIAIIMAALLICVIWFAPEIILVMAGKKYEAAVGVVPPVAISLLLLLYAQLFINTEFYYEEKKFLVGASIGAAIINIVLNAIFIPVWGFVVAGYTTLISYIIFTVSNYIAVKKILAKKNIANDAFNIKGLISVFLLLVVMSIIGMLLYDTLIVRIIVAIIVFLIMFVKKNKIIVEVKGLLK